jgi:4-alpha-glucanotransferase
MLKLVMVLHGHQPVGNFDNVFQMAYQQCYRPVLDLLNAHPGVRTGLHISGPLFEWIEVNHPECIDQLGEMVERNQIEILSGGFFEPLLAAIPTRDARGQIFLMNNYITERFGTKPEGFWLTERVWDSSLPFVLKDSDLSYTIVDDTHFYYAGLKEDDIYGSYITEKEGSTLRLLATPMIMRYMIPFRLVEDVINHLRTENDKGRNIALYGDDIEKFGLWPGTHEWVIEKKWLDTFFSSLEQNASWLQTQLPKEYVSLNQPLGRIYLPQASYEEMTQWALPAERTFNLEKIISSLKKEGRWDEWRPFVRGGIWDNFLVKYEESNRMQKKMFFLSEKSADNDEARGYVWRAQCNCAYWHGVFGGLYLGHLRRAVHENLIKAQRAIMKTSSKKVAYFYDDIDKDGHKEILVWTDGIGLGISPRKGGGIFELCHFPSALNLSDILTRRREAYHYELGNKKQGVTANEKKRDGIPSIHDISGSGDDLTKLIVYDKYDKISLLDHFLGDEATCQGYAVNNYPEEGDFVQAEFILEEANVGANSVCIRLAREGSVDSKNLKLGKSINIQNESGITIDFSFENRDSAPLKTRYGCEFNLNLYSDLDPKRYYLFKPSDRNRNASEIGSEDDLTSFEFANDSDNLRLIFEFSRPVSCWFYPIMTVSKSEEGFEYTYQGTSLLFSLPIDLAPAMRDDLQLKLRFTTAET